MSRGRPRGFERHAPSSQPVFDNQHDGIVEVAQGDGALRELAGVIEAANNRKPVREEKMSANEYYSEELHGPHQFFELGNFELESGITLPDARLAYRDTWQQG